MCLRHAVVLLFCIPFLVGGEVHLAPLFIDGAVLQPDRAVPLWGTATTGSAISVRFAGQMREVGSGLVIGQTPWVGPVRTDDWKAPTP